MWIVMRLILAVVGFGIRQWRRRRPPRPGGAHEGAPYYQRNHKRKNKTVAVSLGMPLAAPTWIRMHRESRFDRFCKRVGVATEIETGDAAFDDAVYVTCDHPSVADLLAGSPDLRAAVGGALATGARGIRYDGHAVWLDRVPAPWARPEALDALARLRDASGPLTAEPPRWFADRFLWKALVVEGAVWGVLGYAIGALIEHVFHSEDVHVRSDDVFALGLATAAVAFVVLVCVIGLWLRGSSRGHRIIVESAIVLVLGLPLASIQAVGDSNRALDDAAPIVVTRAVERCEIREHRGKRNRRTYSYHVWLRPAAEHTGGPSLPSEIKVTRPLCEAAARAPLVLELGPGRWGLPWYRRLEADGVRWTAP